MSYLARETAGMTDEKLREMLLAGAERIVKSEIASESGSWSADSSMDLDYGHELIDAVLDEIEKRARNEVIERIGDPYEATDVYKYLKLDGLAATPPWELR